MCRCVVGGPSSGGGGGLAMMANGGLPAKASSGGGGGKDFLSQPVFILMPIVEINSTHKIVKKRDQLNKQFDSRKYEFRNCFHFEPLNNKMTLAGTCLISQCFE